MTKVKTMSLSGNDYAKVAERVKQFRSENPQGLIETTPTINGDSIMFKARVLKDKSNPHSAEGIGHSYGVIGKKQKDFEKLETISVGRALAMLGYAADGEIASSEEMEEFEKYRKEQHETLVFEWGDKINTCTTLDELKKVWAEMPPEAKKDLDAAKEIKKTKLINA